MAGISYSSDFPTTSGAYQTSCSSCSGSFALKLSANGDSLEYSTLVNGQYANVIANAIAIDESGNAYITGEFDGDALVEVLNPTGSNLTYSIKLPSAIAYAIAVSPEHRGQFRLRDRSGSERKRFPGLFDLS